MGKLSKKSQSEPRKWKKRWSSCSTKGNITLNSELTKLPKEIAEYAILHELPHLIIPNHGKTFKALIFATCQTGKSYITNSRALNRKARAKATIYKK